MSSWYARGSNALSHSRVAAVLHRPCTPNCFRNTTASLAARSAHSATHQLVHEDGFVKRRRSSGVYRGGLRIGRLGVMAALVVMPAAGLGQTVPRLAHEKYTLPNGLEVILAEDHSVPVVAVNTWFK